MLRDLVDRELGVLNKKLAEREVSVCLDEGLYEDILRRGYDTRYGARPLKAVFRKTVAAPLAQSLLGGELKKGSLLARGQREGGVEFCQSP